MRRCRGLGTLQSRNAIVVSLCHCGASQQECALCAHCSKHGDGVGGRCLSTGTGEEGIRIGIGGVQA
eukprot:1147064-Pelagomonas_calceolata.AAC.6